MSVHDNLQNGRTMGKNIYTHNCFAHFMHNWNSWMMQKKYICGFQVQKSYNEYDYDLHMYKKIKFSNKRGVPKFVRELHALFPKAKRVHKTKLKGVPAEKAKFNSWYFFEINPAEWKTYAEFSLFFSTLRLIEEYPHIAKAWLDVDKQVGNELDFFQKLTIAHYLVKSIPSGHNIYDYYYLLSGKQTIENVTWPLLKAKIDKGWDHKGSLVGANCSLMPPKSDTSYYRNTPKKPEILKQWETKKFNYKEFKACMDQLAILTDTLAKAA